MKILISLLLIGPLMLAAATAAAEAPVAADPGKQFGDAIAADLKVSALRIAVADYSADAPAQVISGRVGQVCQKKGCWMTLTDGDVMARVMTDYKFVLPKDLSGEVVVFGTLQAIDLAPEEAEHMAKDAGKSVSEIATREYRIAARGVALR
jgi:Domain of unknown function (DUF4920)